LRRLIHLPSVWILIAAAVVVQNGALGGLPFLLAAAALLGVTLRQGVPRPDHLDWFIALAAGLGLVEPPGAELSRPFPRFSISLLIVTVAIIGVIAWRRPRFATLRALIGCVAIFAVAGALVIRESPNPRIDVFGLEQGGSAALLEGKNPYQISYPNPYTPEETQRYFGDDRRELKQYPYPPLTLAWTTLGFALGGDVRWALLAAQLAIPLLLYLLAEGCGQPPRVAFALAILELVHPRATFVLEQAWNESLIGSAFLLFLLLATQGARALLGGLALGLFLASKQYSVVVLPLLWPRRAIPRSYWLPAAIVVALVMVPFAAWGLSDFLEDVVLFQLRQPARPDAMSLPALLQWATGIRLPGLLAVLAASLALVFWWPRVVAEPRCLALAAACVYGVFFIAAKQAFCNYYYFLGIVVLAAAAMTPADYRPRKGDPRVPPVRTTAGVPEGKAKAISSLSRPSEARRALRRRESPTSARKKGRLEHSSLRQDQLGGNPEHTQPIDDAPLKVDRRRIWFVPSRTAHFPDPVTKVDALGEHLSVEDEVVTVLFEGQLLEDVAREGAVTGVVFAELCPGEEVLRRRERTIGNVLIERHAADQSAARKNARAENHVEVADRHQRRHGGQQLGRILVVGVQHDDDIGVRFERRAITGLLIPSVPAVLVVHDEVETQAPRDGGRIVTTRVVHHDDVVDHLPIHVSQRPLQRASGIVGGHDHGHPFAFDHECTLP
jgi:hypothetical protein